MFKDLIALSQTIVSNKPDALEYLYLSAYSTLYFALLYFGLGFIIKKCFKFLERNQLAERISKKDISYKQLRFEVRNSTISILIFGLSVLPIVYFAQLGIIQFVEHSIVGTIVTLIGLLLYNEFHFFVIHRLLHVPNLFKRIHYIHHKSRIPSVYSVYSFHWIEAVLLSTVPITICPFVDLDLLGVMLFPMASIIFNFIGHSNYSLSVFKQYDGLRLSSRHQYHHSKNNGNYSFITRFLDKLTNQKQKE